MNCPVCETVELREREEGSLQTWFCDACHGHWLEREAIDASSGSTVSDANKSITPEIVESARSLVCPTDGRLMVKYRLMVGVEFYFDRCSDCGGILIDRQEWDLLRSGTASIQLPDLFNGWWEERTIQERSSEFINVTRDRMLKDLLTEDEYCELSRIRHWLDRHPRRREVLGSLYAGEESGAPMALAQ